MASTPSASYLPPELVRDITENLADTRDRPTLVSLALVNTAWRHESQRILFRTVCDGGYQTPLCVEHEGKYRETHIRFLRAILDHPNRLGPYVRSYAQMDLAAHTSYATDQYQPRKRELWDLTLKALALFTNLKRLAFLPMYPASSHAGTMALSRCSFQLESLAWGCLIPEDTEPIEQFFLSHGSHLRHCDSDIGHHPMHLQWLPHDACKALTSVSCRFSSFHHVVNTRRLTAVKLTDDALPIGVVDSSAAAAVKYLSVDSYPPRPGFPNVKLLRTSEWSIGTISTFSQMTNLRILVFRQGYDFTLPDLTEEQVELDKVIQESCRRCPNLECIIHELMCPWDAGERHYMRFSISRNQSHGTGSALRVHRETVTVFKELFTPWWEIYDVA